MGDPLTLEKDEKRRVGQHENVKSKVRHEIDREIEEVAKDTSPRDQAEVGSVARDLKHRAISEVAETETELDRAKRATRVSQIVDYAFGLIYGLIALQIGLELLGARESSGFKRFMDVITAPLLAPFKGMMPDPAVGSFQLMLSYIVGLVVYFLLHLAVRGLLRLLAQRKTAI